jgi:AraC-like DNA-binding protein
VDQLADPDSRVPVHGQLRFLPLAADALQDDLLGFHLARSYDMRETGLLHYVAASSENVEEAVRRLARYSGLVHDGTRLQTAFGRELAIALEYVAVPRQDDRHQAEIWITVILDFLRKLTAKHLLPLRVLFRHSRREIPREIALHYGAKIEFGAGVDEIVFEGAVSELPVVTADPYLNRLLVQYAEEALRHRRPVQGSFRTAVENVVVPELPHAAASAERVARRLGLSRRSFARKLAAEGLTFSGLLDELRLDLANRYLADPKLSISQIAWLLGYREVSAFSKAYRRWTGRSPRAARAGGAAQSDPSPN